MKLLNTNCFFFKVINKFTLIFGVLFLVFAIFSCEKLLIDSEPSTSNTSVFEEYTTLVREKYAMLEPKGIKLDDSVAKYRALITDDMANSSFFNVVSQITLGLNDAHSVLEDFEAKRGAYIDLRDGYPDAINSEVLLEKYINNSSRTSLKSIIQGKDHVYWGEFKAENIGYIRVNSWDVKVLDSEIEQIYIDIKNTKGLIFDMRANGGGDPLLSAKFASYLIDETVEAGYEEFKTGPGPKDFTKSNIKLNPASSTNKYIKPIIILTNRDVYSASSTFIYLLEPIKDRIQTLGQKTGGGTGSVSDGYLSNGWHWSLSISNFVDFNGRDDLDGGVDPDISISLKKSTSEDSLIEAAINKLK